TPTARNGPAIAAPAPTPAAKAGPTRTAPAPAAKTTPTPAAMTTPAAAMPGPAATTAPAAALGEHSIIGFIIVGEEQVPGRVRVFLLVQVAWPVERIDASGRKIGSIQDKL